MDPAGCSWSPKPRPIDGAERATKPALFIVARDDRFVTPSHGRGIHEKYGADKGLLLVRGSHNTPRPAGLFDASIGFLRHCLRVPATLAQPRGVTPHNDLLPPWESLQRMREEALAAAEMRSAQRLPQAVQSAHATLRAARRSDSGDGHVDKRARLNSSSDAFAVATSPSMAHPAYFALIFPPFLVYQVQLGQETSLGEHAARPERGSNGAASGHNTGRM